MLHFLSALSIWPQSKTLRFIWINWLICSVPFNWSQMIEGARTNIRLIFLLNTSLFLMNRMSLHSRIECHWVSPLFFHEDFTVSNLYIARVIRCSFLTNIFRLLGSQACLKESEETSLARNFQIGHFSCPGSHDLGDSLLLHCLIEVQQLLLTIKTSCTISLFHVYLFQHSF